MIFKAGDIFDEKYELLEELGRGGIGVVFKAKQLDYERIVALKILKEDAIIDEELIARFLREAKTLSRLSLANIVTVYHLGSSKEGIPYLSMEYLPGESLRKLINQGSLSVPQSLKICRDLARALAELHARSIVHRDIKPENIIVQNIPEKDTVKLLDFGFVRLIGNADQSLTRTGELIGTVAYMSPEQCLAKPASFATDIYSLTVCLFEMLSGTKPFDADNPVGLMYKHLNQPVPALPENLSVSFRNRMNEFIKKGMAKEAEQRFSGMQEFADELEKIAHAYEPNQKIFTKSKAVPLYFLALLLCGFIAFFFILRNERESLNHLRKTKNEVVFATLSTRKQLDYIRACEMAGREVLAADYARILLKSKSLIPAERAKLLFVLLDSDIPDLAFNAYCQIRDLFTGQNAAILPKNRTLTALIALSDLCKTKDLYAESLRSLNLIDQYVSKNGLPEKHGRLDSSFGEINYNRCRLEMACLKYSFGETSQANELLNQVLQQDAFSPESVARACFKLNRRAELSLLPLKCKEQFEAYSLSDICRSFGDQKTAFAALARARQLPDLSNGDNPQRPVLAEAFLLIETGQGEKAALILTKFKRNSWSRVNHLIRPQIESQMASALFIVGKLKDGLSFLPDEKSPLILPTSDEELEGLCRGMHERRPEITAQVDLLLNSKRLSPRARCVLTAVRLRYSPKIESAVLWSSWAVQEIRETKSVSIERPLRLLCIHHYSGLLRGRFPLESLRANRELQEDLNKYGLPDKNPYFNEWDASVSVFDRYLTMLQIGEAEKVRSLVHELLKEKRSANNFCWPGIYRVLLSLREKDKAAELLEQCPEPVYLREMAAHSLPFGCHILAERSLDKSDALLKDAPLFQRLMNRLIRADFYIEASKKEEARRIFNEVFKAALKTENRTDKLLLLEKAVSSMPLVGLFDLTEEIVDYYHPIDMKMRLSKVRR
ncbi:MAG: serine/threonine protein kinase [Candidatus Obscuribacterales bacterium]|nr:serine/threonine protein kinase [Candidatus Obscuribacterales bacterium]